MTGERGWVLSLTTPLSLFQLFGWPHRMGTCATPHSILTLETRRSIYKHTHPHRSGKDLTAIAWCTLDNQSNRKEYNIVRCTLFLSRSFLSAPDQPPVRVGATKPSKMPHKERNPNTRSLTSGVLFVVSRDVAYSVVDLTIFFL